MATTEKALELSNYSAEFTASATNGNTAQFPVYLAANETVMIGTCGINGASPDPWGANLVRLRNPQGGEVTSWGVFSPGSGCPVVSRLSYTAPAAGTYTVWAGCTSNDACEGTLGISRRKAVVPYSASNTNAARQNTFNKQYYFNGGEVIRVSTCASNAYGSSVSSGNTVLRLFQQVAGIYSEVASNDDAPGCGSASELLYEVPSAGYYQIRAGCAGNTSCSASFTVYGE
ncbi:hypothetical protein [Corallococcus sp. AB045]|uniref:hypothetical protein n=1 Tax=Corallococcus sp. AB045 TaxID=2316719 RepID=UPI0011C3D1DD|nr:hypothetical protein [Corallococcus sp. AB045]